MDLNPASLAASMLVGTIGLGFFMYGKKAERMPQLFVGLALMIFPAFIEQPGWMLGIGAGMIGALFFAVRAGL